MCKETLAALEFDASTSKRAQYEAFAFVLDTPGIVTVRNQSHENADEHTYRVKVETGVPVACECPADTYHASACKHRMAVAIRTPVLDAATDHERERDHERTQADADANANAGPSPEATTDGGEVEVAVGTSKRDHRNQPGMTPQPRLADAYKACPCLGCEAIYVGIASDAGDWV